MTGKRVLLIIGGGIAAYKGLELIRRLRERGLAVRAILTESGAEFVTALSVGSLTGDKVYQDLFSLTDEAEMGHIQLSRSADLVVVAPATANLIARMAAGLADDLATTALLATDKPILIAPAMNVRMWAHPATQRNLALLVADGVHVVGPGEGEMACGEFGPGRMAEPDEIADAVVAALDPTPQILSGRRALVTAGPTHEPIDPVRFLANRSSGRQGYAIAAWLARFGAETVLVSGPTGLAAPTGVKTIRVETASDMKAACDAALPADIAVCTAAVADWRVENRANQKLKKTTSGVPTLKLVPNPDILAELSRLKSRRPALVIGFAAETEKVLEHARAKRIAKGCDWIIANDVSPGTGIMGGENNTVHVITETMAESWPSMAKDAVAEKLALRIAAHFGAK